MHVVAVLPQRSWSVKALVVGWSCALLCLSMDASLRLLGQEKIRVKSISQSLVVGIGGPLATRQRKLCLSLCDYDEFKEAVLAVKAVDLSTTTPTTNCNNRSTLPSVD